jgi:hypothetical protein
LRAFSSWSSTFNGSSFDGLAFESGRFGVDGAAGLGRFFTSDQLEFAVAACFKKASEKDSLGVMPFCSEALLVSLGTAEATCSNPRAAVIAGPRERSWPCSITVVESLLSERCAFSLKPRMPNMKPKMAAASQIARR